MNMFMYTGKILHTRYSPVSHTFVYPYYCFSILISSLKNNANRLLSHNRFNVFSIIDKDYIYPTSEPISIKLDKFINEQCPALQYNKIYLITTPRVFGYAFNPASFFYIYHQDTLSGIIVQINNTYSERHLYLLTDLQNDGAFYSSSHKKEFFVSPFNDLQGEYQFKFSELNDELNIQIYLCKNQQKIIHTFLFGKRKKISDLSLVILILKYPLLASLTILRISKQAIILRYKGLFPLLKPDAHHPLTVIKNNKVKKSE